MKHSADIASVLAHAITDTTDRSYLGQYDYMPVWINWNAREKHPPVEQKMSSISTFRPHMHVRSRSGEGLDPYRVEARAMFVVVIVVVLFRAWACPALSD